MIYCHQKLNAGMVIFATESWFLRSCLVKLQWQCLFNDADIKNISQSISQRINVSILTLTRRKNGDSHYFIYHIHSLTYLSAS